MESNEAMDKEVLDHKDTIKSGKYFEGEPSLDWVKKRHTFPTSHINQIHPMNTMTSHDTLRRKLWIMLHMNIMKVKPVWIGFKRGIHFLHLI